MLSIANVIGRVVAFPFGASLIYISLFFTKGDDGRVQNWLVDLWIRVESDHTEKGVRLIAFFNQTAALVNRALDRVFGFKLFSLRFFVASAALSLCSQYFFDVLRVNEHTYGRLYYGYFFAAAAFIAVNIIKHPSLRISIPLLVLDIALFIQPMFVWKHYYDLPIIWDFVMFVGLGIGILLDAGFVTAIRAILKKQEAERGLGKIIGATALNLCLGVLLLAPSLLYIRDNTPIFELYQKHPTSVPLIWSFVVGSTTNLFAVLCAFSLLLVSLVAILHKLLWGAASRLIHVCYERRVVENRILLFTIGAALLSYSTHWFDWLRQIPH